MMEDLAPWITSALLVGLFAWLRSDIRRAEDRLRAEMSDMRSDLIARIDRLDGRVDGLNGRIDGLDERLRAVEAGLAELRGQLGFVRDYILRRNAPPDEPSLAPAE